MDFGWPLVLLGLLAVPALAAWYVWLLRRRRRGAVAYSSVALIRAARPGRAAWRRHVPVAAARGPGVSRGGRGAAAGRGGRPAGRSAVILALDVSGSMCATDVEPNRLSAAQAAVRDFIKDQDDGTRIGLVCSPASRRSPSRRRPSATADPGRGLAHHVRGTAIGAAILKSVDAISEIDPNVEPAGPRRGSVSPVLRAPRPARRRRSRAPAAPEIVVLLTDGANTAGIQPVPAAHIAASRGVRVYPIGFGTTNPTSRVCTAAQLGGTRFDNPGGQPPGGFGALGRRGFLVADEDTLRQVATVTGGQYFSAKDADQLQGVLEDLPRQVESTTRDVELSAALAGLAVLLILLGIWAAARWTAFP